MTNQEIQVRAADPADETSWNAFVEQHPAAHLAHRFPWFRIISSVFGHRPYYFVAYNTEGRITGLLPLFHVRSILFGDALISVPYLNGGGPLGEDTASICALRTAVENLAQRIKPSYIELRHRQPCTAYPPEVVERVHKAAMILQLAPKAEDLFNSFPAKLRSQIRRPTKDGLSVILDRGAHGPEGVDKFYQVFAENMRDLGTPVYPRRFFFEAQREFAQSACIATALKESSPVASGFTIGTNFTCEIPWASALRRYNKQAPNMLVYWSLIKAACEDGWKGFDFGRSTVDSSTFRFKQQWGAAPHILHWYYLPGSGNIPEVSPKSKKFAALVACWQRLPLPLANLLGPWLTRSLP